MGRVLRLQTQVAYIIIIYIYIHVLGMQQCESACLQIGPVRMLRAFAWHGPKLLREINQYGANRRSVSGRSACCEYVIYIVKCQAVLPVL